MTSSHLSLESLVAQVWQSMRSRLLMMSLLKSDFKDPTSYGWESGGPCEKMLEWVLFNLAKSPWCNTVMLFRKKDAGPHFCIDFCKLNVRTKNDLYPLLHIHEVIESFVGLCISPVWTWKQFFGRLPWMKHQNSIKPWQWGTLGFLNVNACPLVVQCPCNLSEVNAELPRWPKANVLFTLFGQHNCLSQNQGGAFVTLVCCVWMLLSA